MAFFNSLLDAQLFGQPQFRFVDDFFQASKAGEGKAVHRKRTDFADGRIGFERRAATFFVNQCQHRQPLDRFEHQLMQSFDMLRTAQSMVAWNQVQFDRITRCLRQELSSELSASFRQDDPVI